MEFKNRYVFNADREEVFDAMTDPEAVAACLPGCEGLEALGGNRYRATMTVGVAAIKGRFQGTVELCDLDRPASYALRVEGRSSVGFAKGEARIEIEASDSASQVEVRAKAQVGGPVARVGQRLLAGTAKMIADKFFSSLRARIETSARVRDGSQ